MNDLTPNPSPETKNVFQERGERSPKRPISGRFYLSFMQLACDFAAVLFCCDSLSIGNAMLMQMVWGYRF
jgi:hypothetical protein